ncbi:glycogen debranching protein GlgX [Arcanobacterium haemolyticum]|nr:glycogen debranching protein GlgX [Arcanobacterium haemolyticum]
MTSWNNQGVTSPATPVIPGSLYSLHDPVLEAEPAQIPVRLGAHLVGDGADFALRAPHASAVHVCIFDDEAGELVERRFALTLSMGTWSGHIRGIRAGQRYGYRVHGRWAPEDGLRYNPAKLVLDPYARAITRTPVLNGALYSHRTTDDLVPYVPLEPDNRDSAPYMCYGVVLGEDTSARCADPLAGSQAFPISHPFVPWDETVIYEGHVRGLTARADDIPEDLRGTYAGLAHPASIARLTSLGITTLELLPIHANMSEPFLTQKGLTNYWGYNTLSFFAPEPSYATQQARDAGPQAVVDEVRAMVRDLHAAGIEVILDVVYNHTCEGPIDGPTLSWRGIEPTSYYMQEPGHPGAFMDTTGCGNSLDFRRQKVVRLTLDSLRYWVSEIGVDGFRFDLAVTLGRNGEQFDSHHPLHMAITTDPILAPMKIINEPWDLGPNGWQTGRFCPPTADWNDHFRDTVRSFWVAEPRSMRSGGSGGDLRDLATRLAGSADLFGHGREPGGRGTFASINFVTAHDGFTLRDLVSYDVKHNEANLEDNRDGSNDNKSWNHGWEGTEGAPALVHADRLQTMRNLLGTLLFAAGTPMLTAGDDIGRTQGGNNNSYCQDNETSWVDWNLEPWQEDLRATTTYLLQLRRENKVLRPTRFYSEGGADQDAMRDLVWLDADATPMPEHKWFDVWDRTLQMFRSGRRDDADALIVVNGSLNQRTVTLPKGRSLPFILAWDSTWDRPRENNDVYAPGAITSLPAMSMRLYLSLQPHTSERAQ